MTKLGEDIVRRSYFKFSMQLTKKIVKKIAREEFQDAEKMGRNLIELLKEWKLTTSGAENMNPILREQISFVLAFAELLGHEFWYLKKLSKILLIIDEEKSICFI